MTTPTHSHKHWTDKGGHVNEIWSKAISALGDELGGSASRSHSQLSTNAITIKDQSGKIIARASYAGNAFGPKQWRFRYKKA